MSRRGQHHMCDSKELLVAYLYDELDSSAKRTYESHVSSCAECRDEIASLRATRGQLAGWTPPEPDFGFRIVRGAAAPPPSRFRITPAWGLAAAAMLVLAIGAAIANLDVRYGPDGLAVRTGWQHSTGAPATDPNGATPVDWKVRAEALDKRVRDLEQAIARSEASPIQRAAVSDRADAAVLEQVRELVGQSETRQQRALAARLQQLTRDFDAQRRVDLAAIDQGMARLQSTSGAEVKQYRDAIQRIYRATYQQK
jgi:hypothetical protein